MRTIDADALMADCQLAQKQADRHGREFANAFYSGGGEISTEWWCVEDMIENAPTIEPERKTGMWVVVDDPDNRIYGKCSVCGWEAHLYEDDVVGMDYCPNCGSYNGGRNEKNNN